MVFDDRGEPSSPGRYYQRSTDDGDRWKQKREQREAIAEKGVLSVWGKSPTREELQQVYEEHEEAKRKADEDARAMEKQQKRRLQEGRKQKRSRSSSSSSSGHKKRKKHKKEKKEKKKSHKKSKKHKKEVVLSSSEKESSSEAEEWVEMTKEIREEVQQKQKAQDAEMIGPQIPEHLLRTVEVPSFFELDAIDRKNMPRGEAAAMAAYAAQGKRIPRRGEIGLSSDEIATFETVGYVMSGTRHKSMEATRLRKENQIMTAEEKRLLSGFTQEQRKEKEDVVMKQFQSLISSKRAQ